MDDKTKITNKDDTRSDSELRVWRKLQYRRNILHTRLRPRINGRILSPAAVGNRKSNFKKFADMYINVKQPMWKDDGFTRLKNNSAGYKALSRLADTEYGSSVIKEMINNPKKYKGFRVRQSLSDHPDQSAFAHHKLIVLPEIFPNASMKFLTSKQWIYDLAILYHEFAHTMVFQLKNRVFTLRDERIAVMKFENPVRLRKGMEPRYTYTRKGWTINIITGERKIGKWVVSKYDPLKLVKPTDKDALR